MLATQAGQMARLMSPSVSDGERPAKPDWSAPNHVVLELSTMELRDFSSVHQGVPTLVCAPFALHAASIAAVGALLTYVPAYALFAGTSLIHAPWWDVVLQAVVQGLLTAVISLLLYGRAVSILGASSGAAFAALCPAMTALFAIPVLGEWPTTIEWIAIILISVGVYSVSGGPLPMRLANKATTRKPPAAR